MRRSAAFACFLSAFVIFVLVGCASGSAARAQGTQPPSPKYIFLFIGDGMGIEQVELAERALQAEVGESLRMNRLPVRGQVETRSANQAVTDSAAAGTALAAGVKTDNGVVGQTPDGQPVDSIAHHFVEAGRGVGVLSSVQVNHATPASFYSHVDHRNQYSEIAEQFGGSGIHLLVGRSVNSPDGRTDEILDGWKSSGIAVVDSIAAAADVSRGTRLVVLAPSLVDPAAEEGRLADAVALAIDRLQGPDGFFMMVEGGAIDWKGHSNEAWENLQETLAFDQAIDTAYRFYEAHPEETLIVITADHETGGMSVDADRLDLSALSETPRQRAALDGALPAEGEAITAEVAERAVTEAMGVAELTDEERASIAEAVDREAKDRANAVRRAAKRIIDARAGVTWTTGGHTAANVPVFAVGAGAERFEGTLDNTEIPRRIHDLALGKPLPQPEAAAAAEATAAP